MMCSPPSGCPGALSPVHQSLSKRLCVIVVNYRTAEMTVNCLASIAADGWLPANGRVIVVDNASEDGSDQVVGRAIKVHGWGGWVDLVRADRNGGFAFGNNVAIRQCNGKPAERKPDHILLLNPDTAARPGAIQTLVEFLDAHPKAGIVGSQLLDAEGRSQCGGFSFPSVLGELESGLRLGPVTRLLKRWVVPRAVAPEPQQVDWVSGASFMVRRELFEQIGLLDEGFFMYYEEVDFCRRAKAAGWQVWHVPDSQVVHQEGASSGIREAARPRPRYWYDSRCRYFTKHHGVIHAICAELAFQFGYATWRLRRLLQRKDDRDPRDRFRDGWRYVVVPSLLTR